MAVALHAQTKQMYFTAVNATLRPVLERVSPLLPQGSWLRLTGQRLLLPVYHLSTDLPAPHISPIYPVRPLRQFRADLEYLLRYYQPLSLPELIALVREGRPPDRPVFHLSFDDGLSPCLHEVAPLLAELGVPASFYVNPAFVGNQALFFRFLAALLYQRDGDRRWFDYGYDRQDELARAAAERGLDVVAWLQEHRPYLTVAELRQLAQQGHAIGAHSWDHPEYRLLPLAQQLAQTRRSLTWLREHFPDQPATFAFPFTDFGVGNDWFRAMAPELALSFGAAGLKQDSYHWHLQRVPMEKSRASAGQIIRSEYLYFLLKIPLRKNHIQRL